MTDHQAGLNPTPREQVVFDAWWQSERPYRSGGMQPAFVAGMRAERERTRTVVEAYREYGMAEETMVALDALATEQETPNAK